MAKTDVDPRSALRRFAAKHRTQREAAVALSISQAYLSDLLNGRREFSGTMLTKLGLRRTVMEAR